MIGMKRERLEMFLECHHWKIDYMENGYLGKSYVSNVIEKRTNIQY